MREPDVIRFVYCRAAPGPRRALGECPQIFLRLARAQCPPSQGTRRCERDIEHDVHPVDPYPSDVCAGTGSGPKIP